jgi:hypothetical protein
VVKVVREQNKDYGYVKIFRSIFHNKILNDKKCPQFNRVLAWIYILSCVKYEDETIYYNNETISLKRGQAFFVINRLAATFGWGRWKTTNFLTILQKAGMIKKYRISHGIIVTIVNYGLYNDSNMPKNSQNHTTDHTTDHTQYKKDKKNSGTVPAAEPPERMSPWGVKYE